MALKPDRQPIEYEVTLTLDDVADAGVIVMHKSGSSGSGVAIGDSSGKCALVANPSGGVPAGLLLTPFESVDTTRFHRNFQNDTQLVGDKATLGVKGWWVTNKVFGTPLVGETAYVIGTGIISNIVGVPGGVASTPKVGQFKSTKDADGYVKVAINLPIV